MDLRQQIDYWREGSKDDIEAAEALIRDRKFRHALFFVHLAVEKILKAHVVRSTSDIPPRTHDLLRLSEIARIDMSESQRIVLARLQRYCLEGRYPDLSPLMLTVDEAENEIDEARSICSWLANQLK